MDTVEINVLDQLKSALENNKGEISALIIGIRKKLGQTQEQFARNLGVSFATVNRWENGHFVPSKLAILSITKVVESSNNVI